MRGKRNINKLISLRRIGDDSYEHNTGLVLSLGRAVYTDVICFFFPQASVSLRSLVGLAVQLDVGNFLK